MLASVSLPRARGGVPIAYELADGSIASSPRTRGCSLGKYRKMTTSPVFPAHAGVFPKGDFVGADGQRLPRARGGVPSDTQPVEGTGLSVDFT